MPPKHRKAKIQAKPPERQKKKQSRGQKASQLAHISLPTQNDIDEWIDAIGRLPNHPGVLSRQNLLVYLVYLEAIKGKTLSLKGKEAVRRKCQETVANIYNTEYGEEQHRFLKYIVRNSKEPVPAANGRRPLTENPAEISLNFDQIGGDPASHNEAEQVMATNEDTSEEIMDVSGFNGEVPVCFKEIMTMPDEQLLRGFNFNIDEMLHDLDMIEISDTLKDLDVVGRQRFPKKTLLVENEDVEMVEEPLEDEDVEMEENNTSFDDTNNLTACRPLKRLVTTLDEDGEIVTKNMRQSHFPPPTDMGYGNDVVYFAPPVETAVYSTPAESTDVLQQAMNMAGIEPVSGGSVDPHNYAQFVGCQIGHFSGGEVMLYNNENHFEPLATHMATEPYYMQIEAPNREDFENHFEIANNNNGKFPDEYVEKEFTQKSRKKRAKGQEGGVLSLETNNNIPGMDKWPFYLKMVIEKIFTALVDLPNCTKMAEEMGRLLSCQPVGGNEKDGFSPKLVELFRRYEKAVKSHADPARIRRDEDFKKDFMKVHVRKLKAIYKIVMKNVHNLDGFPAATMNVPLMRSLPRHESLALFHACMLLKGVGLVKRIKEGSVEAQKTAAKSMDPDA